MGFIELLLIGAGLSMDAFAVAVCKGLNMRKINYRHSIVIALFFGGFQAVMPLIGWLLGRNFEQYIVSFDHWVAFVLLALIGGKMIFESLKKEPESAASPAGSAKSGEVCPDDGSARLPASDSLNIKELFVMAIATSIDALAVGITFAFLRVNIVSSVSMIGVITFALSFIGVVIGNKFGSKYEKKAELAGGITLVLIGVKILLEHLGVLVI
jgi:Predicted membrane protein